MAMSRYPSRNSSEYEEWLNKRLSIIERVTDKFTGLDERLDYLNRTLERMSKQFEIAPPTVTPPITIDGRIDAIVTKLNQIVDLISRIPEAREEVMPPTIPIFWGRATGGTESTLFDRSQMWADDIWKGYEITIVKGVGIGQSRKISSNNIDTITVTDNFTTKPDHTSIYVIRRSRGIDIEAQSIGNLAIDIAAQTVSRLSVDLAAQTIERLSVDIAAQSLSILDMDITAISYTGNFNINAVAAQIMMPIDVQGSYIMMPIDVQSSYIMMPVDIQAQYLTLNMNIETCEAIIAISINAENITGQLPISINAAYITGHIPISFNIGNLVGNIPISINTENIVGNVSVNLAASAVTLNVAITACTPVLDFNIRAQAVVLNFKFSDQAKGMMLETDWATKHAYDVHLQGKIDSLAPGAESTLITLALSTTKEHWLYTTHISGTQAGLGRVRADKTAGYDELAYGYFPADNGYIKDWLAPVKRGKDVDEGITEITAIVKNLDSALYGAFSATLDGITMIDVAAGEQLYTTQADWQACSVVYHVDLLASPGDVLLI